MEPISKTLMGAIQTVESTQERETYGDDEWYLPEGSICPQCKRIRMDFPGVDKVLESRGFTRVIGRLVACLCEGYDERRSLLARLHRFANLPHPSSPRTFHNFERVEGTSDALQATTEYANGQAPFKILVLVGPTGCGKSHLLEATARRLIERHALVKYEYVPALLDKLRASYQKGAPEDMRYLRVLESYEKAQTLILDDMGAEKTTDWVKERLSMFVDARYRTERGMLVATNLTYEEIVERCGERMASRLYDNNTGIVKRITMDCEDYRGRR